MKRKNTTRNALFTSVLALLLCISMLVGTTFAWFTDEVVSGTNVIAAGNLDVGLYNGLNKDADEVTTGTMLFEDIELWEPGVVAYENLTVANLGTLALKYQLSVNFENATPNPKVPGKTLANALKVAFVEDGISGYPNNDAGRQQLVEDLTANNEWQDMVSFAQSGKLEEKNETDTYGIVIYWEPTANDNDFNMNNTNRGTELKIDLGVRLFATQLDHEYDSFGNKYDLEATMLVTNAAELSDAVANAKDGEVIKVVDAAGELGSLDQATIAYEGTKKITVMVKSIGTLTYNVPDGDVHLMFDTIDTLNVLSAADNSLYLYGNVAGGTVNAGHVVAMGDAQVTLNVEPVDNANVSIEGEEEATINVTLNIPAESTAEVEIKGNANVSAVEGSKTDNVVINENQKFEGNGLTKDEAGIYYVSSAAGLAEIRDMVNGGKNFKNETVKLTANIDLGNQVWTPIGISSSKGFSGTFDGDGYKIMNLQLKVSVDNATGTDYGAGLFGNMLNGSAVKNLTIDGVNYTESANCVAAVTGYVYGSATFENITVKNANILSFAKVGGIVGLVADPGAHTITLKNCDVEGTLGGAYNMGGLMGLVLENVTVNMTDCSTDVDFILDDRHWNCPYGQNANGTWYWDHSNGWDYAAVAENYCYYAPDETELFNGVAKNVTVNSLLLVDNAVMKITDGDSTSKTALMKNDPENGGVDTYYVEASGKAAYGPINGAERNFVRIQIDLTKFDNYDPENGWFQRLKGPAKDYTVSFAQEIKDRFIVNGIHSLYFYPDPVENPEAKLQFDFDGDETVDAYIIIDLSKIEVQK